MSALRQAGKVAVVQIEASLSFGMTIPHSESVLRSESSRLDGSLSHLWVPHLLIHKLTGANRLLPTRVLIADSDRLSDLGSPSSHSAQVEREALSRLDAVHARGNKLHPMEMLSALIRDCFMCSL